MLRVLVASNLEELGPKHQLGLSSFNELAKETQKIREKLEGAVHDNEQLKDFLVFEVFKDPLCQSFHSVLDAALRDQDIVNVVLPL